MQQTSRVWTEMQICHSTKADMGGGHPVRCSEVRVLSPQTDRFDSDSCKVQNRTNIKEAQYADII